MKPALPNAPQVLETLRRNEVVFAAMFGSRAKGNAHNKSVFDLLVEFAPHAKTSLFRLVGLQDSLAHILGGPVDLVTTGGLNPLMKDEVMSSLMVLYDQRPG